LSSKRPTSKIPLTVRFQAAEICLAQGSIEIERDATERLALGLVGISQSPSMAGTGSAASYSSMDWTMPRSCASSDPKCRAMPPTEVGLPVVSDQVDRASKFIVAHRPVAEQCQALRAVRPAAKLP
jgi:hypothetical protein